MKQNTKIEEKDKSRNNEMASIPKFNFGLYATTACILCALLIGYFIFNSLQTNCQVDKNRKELTNLTKVLNTNSRFCVSTDSHGRQYIDSVNVALPAQSAELNEYLKAETVNRIAAQSEILARAVETNNNNMTLWAAVLTLLSVLFTFLGLMELKERTAVIDHKAKEVDKALKEVRQDTKLSSYILEIQMLEQYNLSPQIRIDEHLAIAQRIEEERSKETLNETMFCTLCSWVYFLIARHYYIDLSDWKNAIRYYTKAIDINKDYVIAYNNRGVTYYELEKYQEAIADYTEAIRLDSNYANAYLNRGFAYFQEKNYPKAKADAEAALAIDPNDENAKKLLKEILEKE